MGLFFKQCTICVMIYIKNHFEKAERSKLAKDQKNFRCNTLLDSVKNDKRWAAQIVYVILTSLGLNLQTRIDSPYFGHKKKFWQWKINLREKWLTPRDISMHIKWSLARSFTRSSTKVSEAMFYILMLHILFEKLLNVHEKIKKR